MKGPRYSILPADAVFDPNLSRLALHVLAAIATHTDNNGWCVVRQRTIAERINSTQASVRNAVSELVRLGYLRVMERFGSAGERLANHYQVSMDRDPPSADNSSLENDHPPASVDDIPPHSHVRGPRTPTLPLNKNDLFLERPSSYEDKRVREKTAKEELEEVLDTEHAVAVIDHRKKLRKNLTAHAAKLLAKKFAACSDANAAADAMIANGWQGFEPEWLRPTNSKQPAQRAPDLREIALKRLQANGGGGNVIEH